MFLKSQRIIKWLTDRIIATIALIVLSPLFLLLYIIIFLKMGSPVIFSQLRPGKNGEIFQFYKFRSMTDERDNLGNLLPDEKRLTDFGQFLRKTSLDELPQLWNVLKGDMSFVGPRPLLVEYLDRYTPTQSRRHEVKPGITGLAQVKGRNAISWEEKFKLDIWYIDNWSFWLDLKILILTFLQVIQQKNINQQGQATVKYFQGSN